MLTPGHTWKGGKRQSVCERDRERERERGGEKERHTRHREGGQRQRQAEIERKLKVRGRETMIEQTQVSTPRRRKNAPNNRHRLEERERMATDGQVLKVRRNQGSE